MTILLCCLLTAAVSWTIASSRGWLQGWNEARRVWEPEALRYHRECRELRGALILLSEKQDSKAKEPRT